ncbi:RDD family protein [Mucilaginibacter sp.]|uniref:RDD family protein n=1 Tax=Mucilaginibacter sp. TaxID=1882438 RepID=UPI0032655163
MINSYYILENGEKTGPYTQYELMDMGLDIHTMVLSPLDEDWQQACDLPEFNEYFEQQGYLFPTATNLASFWWRLLAYLLDYIIIIVIVAVFFIVLSIILSLTGGSPILTDDESSTKAEPILNLVGILAMISYHSICEATSLRGGLGKKICKLSVVDANGMRISFSKALSRNLGKILSSMVLGIGFLSIFWDDHRQGWHDHLAKTYIIKH